MYVALNALLVGLLGGVPAWAQAPIEDELALRTPVSKFVRVISALA